MSVRRAVKDTDGGAERLADVVGDLIALTDQAAIIDTRRGLVEVELASVRIARVAPPSTADELALEAVAAAGWQPQEIGAVGGWVLRAADGFTSRANSVLPLRAPGVPLDEALRQAREWYAARGLPLVLAVPTEARRLLDAELGERGWVAGVDVAVLAARLDLLPADRESPYTVEASDTVSDDWLALYRGGEGQGAAGRALLTRHDRVAFASLRKDGEVVAVGRGVVDGEWLGIAAVEVAPDRRRQGMATAVMSALWQWGRDQGARRTYLQVSADNSAALALYARLGYWEHHVYRYWSEPTG